MAPQAIEKAQFAPGNGAPSPALVLSARERRRHPLADDLDRLQGPHHHLEAIDPTLRIPANDVNSVDLDPVDFRDELEHGQIRPVPLPDVSKIRTAEDRQRGGQIFARDRLAALRRVHDRREENDVLGEQRFEQVGIADPHDVVPAPYRVGLPLIRDAHFDLPRQVGRLVTLAHWH